MIKVRSLNVHIKNNKRNVHFGLGQSELKFVVDYASVLKDNSIVYMFRNVVGFLIALDWTPLYYST